MLTFFYHVSISSECSSLDLVDEDEKEGRGLTTLIIPIKTLGGVAFAEMISEMKCAVSPVMVIRLIPWKRRERWKVAPRAPWVCIFFLMLGWVELGFVLYLGEAS